METENEKELRRRIELVKQYEQALTGVIWADTLYAHTYQQANEYKEAVRVWDHFQHDIRSQLSDMIRILEYGHHRMVKPQRNPEEEWDWKTERPVVVEVPYDHRFLDYLRDLTLLNLRDLLLEDYPEEYKNLAHILDPLKDKTRQQIADEYFSQFLKDDGE